jgi:hypothetical protein
VVNEELTAEEWKRRYERERDKVNRLRQQLQSMETEMKRWRAGDKVPESEWASMVADLSANMQQSDNSEFRILRFFWPFKIFWGYLKDFLIILKF